MHDVARTEGFVILHTYQDVFEERQTFAPLDEFVKAFVCHVGQRLNHLLLLLLLLFHSILNIDRLTKVAAAPVAGLIGKPQVLNIHYLLKG